MQGKIFEKIIQGRLNQILAEKKKLIKDRQHGLRSQKGTATAIAIVYETIANALADRRQVYLVLRDVAKAFDKVWYNGLKYKLLHIGLSPFLEETLCNFLGNRLAQVNTGNDFSNNIKLLSGVPQGSVLSPTLYTIYTNDIPSAGPGCLGIMYADDVTQIITTQSKSKNLMKLKVGREINRINRFEKKWEMKTSQEKFKIIPIAQHTKNIVVNGKEFDTSKEGKLLGLKVHSTGIVGHVSTLKK